MKKIISIALTATFVTALFVSCGTGGLDGTYIPKNCEAKNFYIAKLVFNEKEASGDFKLNDNPFTVSGGGNTVKIYMGTMGIAMPMALEGRYSLEGNKLSIEGGIPGINGTSLEFTYNKAKDEISLLTGFMDGALDEFAPVWGKERTFDTTIDPCAKKEETNRNTSVEGKPADDNSKKGGGIFDRIFGSEQEKPNGNTSVEGKPANDNSKKGGGIFDRLFGGDGKGKDISTDMNKEISNETITGTFSYSGGNVAKKIDEVGKEVDLEGDYTTDFVFKTAYFNNSADVYNHELSVMSLQLAMAAYGLHNKTYKSEHKSDNIIQLLKDMKFENVASYGYDEDPKTNSIAVNFAHKSLDINVELLIIAVRGGEYKAEWGGNFYVGDGDVHKGFDIAKETILTDYLEKYLSSKFSPSDLSGKTVKLWITGFSRGAAVANLLSAFFTELANTSGFYQSRTVKIPLQKSSIYSYCFATPNNSKNAKREGYENIFNIINPFDIVPRLPIWGFDKYGRKLLLPIPTNNQYVNYTNAMLSKLDELSSNSTFKSEDYFINKFRFHQGNIGHFYASKLSVFLIVDNAIYDIGRNDKDKNMYDFVEDLCITILPKIMGTTQKKYVEKKQNSVVDALSKSDKNLLDWGLLFFCFKDALDDAIINRDYIATLGPSDEHLTKLISGDGNVGKLEIKDRFPAVYNFNEGAVDFNFNDGYDKIKIEENLKTRKEAVQFGAKEAKHNLYALVSAHYPELYLAWLKSLPASYFQ